MTASSSPDKIEGHITERKSAVNAPEETKDVMEKTIDFIVSNPFVHPFLDRVEYVVIEELVKKIPKIAWTGSGDVLSLFVNLTGPCHAHVMGTISKVMDKPGLKPDDVP